MVVRDKYGGYWNKTRSMVDSRGLSIPCMINIMKIFQPTESPLILPYHAIPDITVPTDTGDKLMPTQGRGFPGSYRYACKAHEDDYHHKCDLFQQHGNHKYASMHMIISHEITSPSKWGGVINVSTNTPKILCRDSECLPSGHGKAGCIPKHLEIFKNPIKRIYLN